ncbi:hypothetical protein EUS_01840 [[Eubacterium] siraeum 70/3]|uniref:Uncharacterized protein n=1 Tax=[Eubacterium] siraeum 70/3 TaxID=657319 RepID=D4JR15_9FIRM|nr:hypothetical protein EUS_01840 [[Eubacterium] siraeum 70/3]
MVVGMKMFGATGGASKARMPEMNAQSFARMRNQQSVHKEARMPEMNAKSFKHGCLKSATQSRCTMQRH